MNVPIPKRRWATRVGVPAAILLATCAVLAWSAWSWLVPAPTVRATQVLVKASLPSPEDTPAKATTSASVQAAGWVEPAPFPVAATALAEGTVAEVLVLEGERVVKDQPIARLVGADAELAARKAEAEVARRGAMVAAARAELSRATETLATRIEASRGLAVADAKARAAQAALDGFAADESERRAVLAEASDDLERKTKAAAGGGVAQGELVRLRLRVDAMRAAVDVLPAKRSLLVAAVAETNAELDAKRRAFDLLLEEKAAVGKAEADAAAAEAELRRAEAELAEARLRLERVTVRSPIDGAVLARLVGPGTRVGGMGEDARIVLLYDPHSLQVRADVPNADIALVGVGANATITLEALPNRTLVGSVTRITGQADIQKNTVQVKIAIVDPPPELRPDMLCRVRIGGDAAAPSASRQRVFAPRDLLRDGAACVVGPLVNGVGVAERRAVRVGESGEDGWTEVVEGLRPGDLLVDPAIVASGTRVRVDVDGLAGTKGADHVVH